MADLRRVARIFWRVQFDHVAQQVPDIAEALDWWRRTVPGATVLYQDETWGLIEAGGTRLAFVMAEEHPNHVAWRVSGADLERLADEHDAQIDAHRDGTRGFYLTAPGGQAVEVIAGQD